MDRSTLYVSRLDLASQARLAGVFLLQTLLLAALLPGCAPSGGGVGEDAVSTWSRTYGGTLTDRAHAVLPTDDGGFLFAGTSESFGPGADDVWVTKLDGGGLPQWSQTYGSGGFDLLEAYDAQPASDGGYVVVGTIMEDRGSTDAGVIKLDADGDVEWTRAIGSEVAEIAYAVLPLGGGGFLVVGTRLSPETDFDGWAFRLDADGNQMWERTYGGPGLDVLRSITRGADGRIVAAGWKTAVGDERHDAWAIALNPQGGIEIERQFFTFDDERATLINSIRPTAIDYDGDEVPDPGYVAVGYREGQDDDGDHEVWQFLLRLDADLHQVRGSTPVDDRRNYAHDVVEMPDGYYVVVGTSCEFEDDQDQCRQYYRRIRGDFVTATAPIQLGSDSEEHAFAAVSNESGEVVLAGFTTRDVDGELGTAIFLRRIFPTRADPGATEIRQEEEYFPIPGRFHVARSIARTAAGDLIVVGNHQELDQSPIGAWVMKLRAEPDLSVVWRRERDDRGAAEHGLTLAQTADGYVVAGSVDGGTDRGRDGLAIGIDENGEVLWKRRLGGPGDDEIRAAAVATDGTIAFAGVTDGGFGGGDVWAALLGPDGELLASAAHGGAAADSAQAIAILDDDGDGATDGFILAGCTESFGHGRSDVFLLRLRPDLTEEWTATYGSAGDDEACAIRVLHDADGALAGYVVAGATEGDEAAQEDVYLLRLDPEGNVLNQVVYGGDADDFATALETTRDGGFAVAATTRSFGGGEFCDNPPCENMWVLRLGPELDPIWQRTYSTSGVDRAHGIGETPTGGLILAGETDAVTDVVDAWVLRTDADGLIDASCPNGIAEELDVPPLRLDDVESRQEVVANRRLAMSLGEEASTRAVAVVDLNLTRQCAGIDAGAEDGADDEPDGTEPPGEPDDGGPPEPPGSGFVLIVHARNPDGEPLPGAEVLVFPGSLEGEAICRGVTDAAGDHVCDGIPIDSELFVEVLVGGGELFGSRWITTVDEGGGRMEVTVIVE